MKIHKKERVLEIEREIEPKEHICLYCEKWKVRSKLTRRPNYEEVDKDMWWYCHNCHRAFLDRDVRMEGRLKSAVDVGVQAEERTVMGLDNLKPTSPQKKAIQEALEKEKDPEVRELIKKGYTVDDQQV